MNSMKEDLFFKPITTDTFKFQCHKDIPCFTKCCANLNLILTPYDILRLKNRLLISSDDFLERFAITKFEDHILFFPMVYLKMNEDDDKKCPFVTHDGCNIYEDRNRIEIRQGIEARQQGHGEGDAAVDVLPQVAGHEE